MVSKQFTYAFMFECGKFFLGNDRNCTILIRTPMIIKTGAEFSGKNFRSETRAEFSGKIYD